MSNFERIRANCLRKAAGELPVAFDLACHEIERLHDLVSAGYIQERRFNPPPSAIQPKKPLKGGPVLIEGEPT